MSVKVDIELHVVSNCVLSTDLIKFISQMVSSYEEYPIHPDSADYYEWAFTLGVMDSHWGTYQRMLDDYQKRITELVDDGIKIGVQFSLVLLEQAPVVELTHPAYEYLTKKG